MPLDWNTVRARLLGYSALGEQRWRERFWTTRTKIVLFAFAILLALIALTHTSPPVSSLSVATRHRHRGPYVEYSLSKHWHGWDRTKRMIVFGDSWSTTCFKLEGPAPSIESPIGTPEWPGETVGNGPNWVGIMTYRLNESIILTADFAIGGATVVDLVHKDWRSMRSQVNDLFTTFNSNHTGFWEPDSSLFFIWIGINDIHNAFNTTEPFPATLDMYSALVDKMYSAGARNFMFVNVPPLSRSPYAIAVKLEETWRSMVGEWNAAVQQLAWDFAAKHKDVTLFYFDAWTLLNDIMDNPCVVSESCDLKVLEDYCPMYALGNVDWNTFKPECPYSADKYFWIDPLHPTTVLQNAVANSMHRALLSSSNE